MSASQKVDLGPKFLRGEDMLVDGVWREYEFTIAKVHGPGSIKAKDGEPVDKPVIEFKEPKERKLMVLGPMNDRFLRCETGVNDATDLVGHRIKIYAAAGNWFGQYTPALRIRVTGGKVAPRVQPANLGKDLTGKRIDG